MVLQEVLGKSAHDARLVAAIAVHAITHMLTTRCRLAVLLGLAVVAAGVGLMAYDRNTEIRWDGSFPLQVELVSKSGRLVRKVLFDTVGRREPSLEDVGRIPWAEFNLRPVENFEGNRFTVPVPIFGRDSGLFRTLRYGQFEVLLLQVYFTDGSHQFEVLDIPDVRRHRRLVVEVP